MQKDARLRQCSGIFDRPLPPLGQYFLGAALEIKPARTANGPEIDPKTATAKRSHRVLARHASRELPEHRRGRIGVCLLDRSPHPAQSGRRLLSAIAIGAVVFWLCTE